jgi:outer membrane protein OmpA-like peptidoglycan-associated protein
MEARMGHDFSHVRVHTDAVAAESTQVLQGEAFTVGSHVVFSAGKYAPATGEGRALLTHELTHVIQQRDAAANEAKQVGTHDGEYEHEADRIAAESNGSPAGVRLRTSAQLVQRRVTASGIAKIPPQFSYSTHCGWIDWGHAQPEMALNLIRDVRAASAQLESAETGRSREPGHHVVRPDEPGVGVYEVSIAQYEPGERARSQQVREPSAERRTLANHDEVHLFGFEVDSADASRFSAAIADIGKELDANGLTEAQVFGFSDSIGSEHANSELRSRRASAIHQLFPETVRDQITVTTPATPSQYLETNTTEEGRRRNRGAAIKLLPPPQTADVLAQQVSKVKRQLPAWARRLMPGAASAIGTGIVVNSATVSATILRPLTPDEELRVALAIFMAVSTAFEETQSATEFIAASSFSEEDLPSNLIGFYRAAHNLTRQDVERIAEVWDRTRSAAQFLGYAFSETRYTFKQLRLPAGGVWPAQFDSIQPEPPGRLWRLGPMTLRAPGSVQYIP